MISQEELNKQPRNPTLTLDKNSALIVGFIGLILPIGIQDFVVRRLFWGSMHVISLLLSPIGLFLWLFDGYCAGGKFCSQPPGILSFIGSCMLGWGLVLLILNLFECIRLMSSRTIVFSKKRFNTAMTISTIIITAALYAYGLFLYYH